jgi:uncharacterized protein (DUF488 family)
LIALLREHAIRRLADVRRYPVSRRHPHFSRETLAAALAGAGITYRHAEDLGGHRQPRPDSPHQALDGAWRRGYADYMEGAAFRAALVELMEWADGATSAVMCAEASPADCHRALLCDALLASGVKTVHILAPGRVSDHALTASARMEERRVIYDVGMLPFGR